MASNEDQSPLSLSSVSNGKLIESSSPSSSSVVAQDGDCQSQLSVSTSSCEGALQDSNEQSINSNQETTTTSSPSSSSQPTNSGGIAGNGGHGRMFAIKILRKPPLNHVSVYTTHECGPNCLEEEKRLKEIKGVKTYNHCILINRVNPYCVPIFLGWSRSKNDGWIVYTAPCGKQLNSLRQVYQYLIKTESGLSIDQFSFHSLLKLHSSRDMFKAHTYLADISEGKENVAIPVVNEIDSDSPAGSFVYIPERIAGKNVNLSIDQEFLSHCVCLDKCKNSDDCSCHGLSRDEAYMISGLDSVNQAGYKYKTLNKKLVSAVFECNSQCTCTVRCLNRVVQNGIKHCLQVFKTSNRGWGLRCLHDIPPGSFVCLYAGEIIDFDTVNESDRINDYIAALDYIEEGRRPKRDFDTASDADSVLDSDSSSSEELSSCEGISNSSIIDDLSDNSDIDENAIDNESLVKDDEDVEEDGDDAEADADADGDEEEEEEKPNCSMYNQVTNGDSNEQQEPSSTTNLDDSPNSCSILQSDSNKRSMEKEDDDVDMDATKRHKKDDVPVPVIDLEEELINEVLNSQALDNEDVIIDFDSMDQSRISSSREGEHGTTLDGSAENQDYSNTINGNGYNGHSGGICEIDDPDDMDDLSNPETIPVILKHLEMTHSFSVDGARFGNVGRFLNHSCEPNCRIRNIFVENHDYRFPRLAFFSTRLIRAYEELTWDYRYPPDVPYMDSKECLCSSRLCRGRIY